LRGGSSPSASIAEDAPAFVEVADFVVVLVVVLVVLVVAFDDAVEAEAVTRDV
jgi:hypothetical protein